MSCLTEDKAEQTQRHRQDPSNKEKGSAISTRKTGFAREKTAHGITLQEQREKVVENEKVHLLRSLGVHPQREKVKAKAVKAKAENLKARAQ